jgi:hypothetical protein
MRQVYQFFYDADSVPYRIFVDEPVLQAFSQSDDFGSVDQRAYRRSFFTSDAEFDGVAANVDNRLHIWGFPALP